MCGKQIIVDCRASCDITASMAGVGDGRGGGGGGGGGGGEGGRGVVVVGVIIIMIIILIAVVSLAPYLTDTGEHNRALLDREKYTLKLQKY